MKRHPQILNREHTALLVVDAQTKLNAVVQNGQRMVEGIVKLVKGFRVLNLSVFSTEQYPQGLGATDPSITEVLDSAMGDSTAPIGRKFMQNAQESLTKMLHLSAYSKTWIVRFGYLGLFSSIFYIIAGIFLMFKFRFSPMLAVAALSISMLVAITQMVVLALDNGGGMMMMSKNASLIFGIVIDLVLLVVILASDRSAYKTQTKVE